jgi:hypothetical protein
VWIAAAIPERRAGRRGGSSRISNAAEVAADDW